MRRSTVCCSSCTVGDSRSTPGHPTGRPTLRRRRDCACAQRAGVDAWFAHYDVMPDDLQAALAATTDIPMDIDPVVPFTEGVE